MHLDIKAETCTGCRICVSYCSFHHEGAIWPARSRITITTESDEGPFIPNVCRQCDDAPCAAACPADAIARDRRTGAWVVDADRCTGC
ncbi:MAG: 4Fe-4S dicluster domain-containing protein, partial [Chloroflexi bacterium]|nr:4Fe-4S dicluster domain-containing protein [Chloroflexota bacterium]